jgi:hypothetical protein
MMQAIGYYNVSMKLTYIFSLFLISAFLAPRILKSWLRLHATLNKRSNIMYYQIIVIRLANNRGGSCVMRWPIG